MKITIKQLSQTHAIPVIITQHDCYSLNDYTIEEYIYYRPTVEQINNNTDHDEVGLVAVCVCGKEMPEIDVYDGVDY